MRCTHFMPEKMMKLNTKPLSMKLPSRKQRVLTLFEKYTKNSLAYCQFSYRYNIISGPVTFPLFFPQWLLRIPRMVRNIRINMKIFPYTQVPPGLWHFVRKTVHLWLKNREDKTLLPHHSIILQIAI